MLAGIETVILVRRSLGAMDEYGLPVVTESQVTVSGVLIGYADPEQTILVDSETIDEKATLYFPHGTEVLATDEFIINGERWEQHGQVQKWVPPFSNFKIGVVAGARRKVG
jgi:hypothetical protein